MTPKEKYILAKSLIGKKAILIGGGTPFNEFEVVEVLDVWENEGTEESMRYQAKLRAPEIVVGEGVREREFTPYLRSYTILPYPPDWDELPIGIYAGLGDKIISLDGPLLGTIYDYPVALVPQGDRYITP